MLPISFNNFYMNRAKKISPFLQIIQKRILQEIFYISVNDTSDLGELFFITGILVYKLLITKNMDKN